MPAASPSVLRPLRVVGTAVRGEEDTVDEVEAKAEPAFGAIAETTCTECVGVFVDVGHFNAEVLRDDGSAYPGHRLKWRTGAVVGQL